MCLFCPAPSVAPSSPWSARRAFLLAAGASAAAPVLAQVEVGSASSLRKLVPAETLENSAAQQYQQMLQQASSQRALGPAEHPPTQCSFQASELPLNSSAKTSSHSPGGSNEPEVALDPPACEEIGKRRGHPMSKNAS